jgi:hypothetical protein
VLLIDYEVLDVWQYLSKYRGIYFGKNKLKNFKNQATISKTLNNKI